MLIEREKLSNMAIMQCHALIRNVESTNVTSISWEIAKNGNDSRCKKHCWLRPINNNTARVMVKSTLSITN